jgi:transketolase
MEANMSFRFGSRRAQFVDVAESAARMPDFGDSELASFEFFDSAYRSLCAMLFNYVPGSGHPGGSISSGRLCQGIVFDAMDYDLSDPEIPGADIVSYSAGHKALGLYALWALRNEVARITRPELLPEAAHRQFRLEDLLGFRRNPESDTPLFRRFGARALDGHPTPATPFVKLATGASGVGFAASVGLGLGAMDLYRTDPPRIHVVEGEGGMTPGRVAEAMAGAATMGLSNVILHVDFNQASIDSNRVCRDDTGPGDYVQWDPCELAWLHDWNVVLVPDGKDFRQILAAQRIALDFANGQPTAVVYKTIKGWQYGIEGRSSHGAGHKLCSPGFAAAIGELQGLDVAPLAACANDGMRCGGSDPAIIEACFWNMLAALRTALESQAALLDPLGNRLVAARRRLHQRNRRPRADAPRVDLLHDARHVAPKVVPDPLVLQPGKAATLREALGNALDHLNRISGGAIMATAADLLGSTSSSVIGKGFGEGFFHARDNADARLFAVGGICEDAMSGVLSGLSSFGAHVGVASSYGAFMAPLGHLSARVHAIGNQARRHLIADAPYRTMIINCAHAGLKTGEDGPTHADPQALQLLQENFPRGTMITLTPWDPQEVWPLIAAALLARPAVIAPFVTRPAEPVLDRAGLGLAPATAAIEGVYCLRAANPDAPRDGTIVLQESGATYAFVQDALPRIDRAGYNLAIYYVASVELFDLLSSAERARIFPEPLAQEAMGITGFTLPTLYRWVRSDLGRAHSIHPFSQGHYLGSGSASAVLREAKLDGESQFRAVAGYVRAVKTRREG